MKIAVTGGRGRIGSAVVDLALSQGHEIVSIDITDFEKNQLKVTNYKLSTTDYDLFKEALQGCDALIHLAAIASPGNHPDHVVHNNNVVSSYNALRVAAELGIDRVCQASSINAIGGAWSQSPHYDYFPVDEEHPTYNDDPYSLSKWICELQADSIVRRFKNITIASLRIHGVAINREVFVDSEDHPDKIEIKHLWGYVRLDSTARACLLGITADFSGHERFYVVAPDTMKTESSKILKNKHFPKVALRGELEGNNGFFDCSKAERLLGWKHQ